MSQIKNVKPFGNEQHPTEGEHKKLLRERQRQEKYSGFQQLTELCAWGELDIAKRLAEKYSMWGYQIVDGTVADKVN